MAVEIPVVIDIDKAFDEAAKKVNVAIQPLKRSIEDATGGIKLKFGEEYNKDIGKMVAKTATLKELIGGVEQIGKSGFYKLKHGVDDLNEALESAKRRLSNLNALDSLGHKADPQKVNALRESISVLTAVIEQRQHESDLIVQATNKQIAETRAIEQGNYALMQEATTLTQISDKLSSLKGKMNNLKPDTPEWRATASEIRKATAELEKYSQKMATATLVAKPGSINKMTAEMAALEKKWAAMSKAQKFDKDGNIKASAQKVIDKFVKLTEESEKYGRSLAETARKSKASIDNTTNSLNKQSSVLKRLTSLAAAYVSVFQLFRFVKNVRDVTAELEYQRVALGKLIQDEEYGAQLFERIKAAAIESPFRITQLVTYTKQLAAYRIEQENLFDVSRRLADISAGLGVEMNRLILAYGQVRAASVLRGQELRQFTEAGIPLVELLAEKFSELRGETVKTADVFKLISERAVPFSMIAEIFEDLTDKGGMFYKMQEEQAKTLKGRWEKLKDAYDIALQTLGETDTFQKYNDIILSVLRGMANNLTLIVRTIESIGVAWAVYKVATNAAVVATAKMTVAIVKQAGVAGLWRAAIDGVRSAWNKLKIAMASNWVGLALSAVAGIVTFLVSFKKKADEATASIEDLNSVIEEISVADKTFEKINKTIDRYEKLADKTNRTAEENVKLNKSMEILRNSFPELSSAIDANSESLSENVKLLRKANELQHGLAVDKAMENYNVNAIQIEAIQGRLSKLQEEQQEAYRKMLYYQDAEGKGTIIESIRVKKLREMSAEYQRLGEAIDKENSELEKHLKWQQRLDVYLNPEKAAATRSEWQNLLISMRQYESEGVTKELFTIPDVEGWDSLGDALSKIKKGYNEAKKTYEAYQNAVGKNGVLSIEWQKEAKAAEDAYNAFNAIKIIFGAAWDGSTKQKYEKDPFIDMLQERVKFMKDYKRGFDDFKKYLGESGAIGMEAGIMLKRGLSIGLSEEDQKRAATDLSGWYEDMINEAFDQAKKHGASGTVDSFLSQEIKGTSNKAKALKDFQSLIQSLWDAKTDIDTSEMKKNFDEAFKNLSEKIKKSEAAKNLFEDIFGLTGDNQLSTSLTVEVFGSPGDDLKKRIQEELMGAFDILNMDDVDKMSAGLKAAIRSADIDYLMKNIEQLPPKLADAVKKGSDAVEKHNSEIAKSYARLLMQYSEIEQQRVDITNKAAKDIETIEEGLRLEIKGILKSEEIDNKKFAIEQAQARAAAAKKAVVNQRDIDLSRLEGDYRLFFSSINILSENTARNIASRQKKMLTDQFVQGKISLSKYKREIKEINSILEKYSKRKFMFQTEGLSGLIDGMKQVSDDFLALASTVKTNGGIWTPTEDAKQFLKQWGGLSKTGGIWNIFSGEEKISKVQQDAERASKNAYWYTYNTTKFLEKKSDSQAKMEAEAAATAAVAEVMTNASDDMAAAAASFESGLAEFEQIFYAIDSMFKFMDREMQRDKKYYGSRMVSYGYALDEALVGSNKKIASSYEAFKKGDIFGAFADLGDAFYQFINPTEEWNNKIKNQEFLIKDLDYQYGRLEKSIKKSFGSDYISDYNKQLETLYAKQAAYQAQADAERGKKKERDADKIEEYENQAREVADQIVDMQHQLAEFFTGTDLTSAAKDFATAWIDAYKEFGSTTDAMREKFNEMLQEMVTNSLAAKVMQTILQPLFDQIDEMSKDGELSANEIAAIATASPAYIEQINNAMTALMNELTAAGYNLRQQPGQFTGIKRNIANATEESVNGLTQAMNVNNFYMSHIPGLAANVASILAIISGGTAEDVTTGASYQLNNELALQYLSSLPNIDQNIAEILRYVKSVISDKNSASNINVVAVRA